MLDGVEFGHARGRVSDAVIDQLQRCQRRAHLRPVHGCRAAHDGVQRGLQSGHLEHPAAAALVTVGLQAIGISTAAEHQGGFAFAVEVQLEHGFDAGLAILVQVHAFFAALVALAVVAVDLAIFAQESQHHAAVAALDGSGGGHGLACIKTRRRLHWRQGAQRQQRRHRAHPKCFPHANSTAQKRHYAWPFRQCRTQQDGSGQTTVAAPSAPAARPAARCRRRPGDTYACFRAARRWPARPSAKAAG